MCSLGKLVQQVYSSVCSYMHVSGVAWANLYIRFTHPCAPKCMYQRHCKLHRCLSPGRCENVLERSQVLFISIPGSKGASETSEGTYLSTQLCKHLRQHKHQAQSFASACNKHIHCVNAPARTWLGAGLHSFLVLHSVQTFV